MNTVTSPPTHLMNFILYHLSLGKLSSTKLMTLQFYLLSWGPADSAESKDESKMVSEIN